MLALCGEEGGREILDSNAAALSRLGDLPSWLHVFADLEEVMVRLPVYLLPAREPQSPHEDNRL